jgi:hypothetical protein
MKVQTNDSHPHTSTDEAKLISTDTSHMTTACGQLNNSLVSKEFRAISNEVEHAAVRWF